MRTVFLGNGCQDAQITIQGYAVLSTNNLPEALKTSIQTSIAQRGNITGDS